ncbi:MAG TPA: hypothetical protein VFM68_01040, partial [Candidatus Saccharimonadales bacterium]|nr:hypothetical protein [Candidatus Saccharimonadales bacterium]
MFPLPLLIAPFTVFLSLSTATGVFVHDTRIDRATLTALAVPSVIASYQASSKLVNFAPDLHPHSESHGFTKAINNLKGNTPKITPRSPGEKKYVSQKNMGLGHNPFDSYALPIS